MKNVIKKSIALLLCMCFLLSLVGCSSANISEKNITSTVATVEQALQEFDQKKLEKYVKSSTLNYILKLAKNKDQFSQLGVTIFENLSMTVESVDEQNATVTLKISNKDMSSVAGDFAADLTSYYSGMELLKKLNDDEFLDASLAELQQGINGVTDTKETTVTLHVSQGKHCLVLYFDDAGEDAVSGGALSAIKTIIGQ